MFWCFLQSTVGHNSYVITFYNNICANNMVYMVAKRTYELRCCAPPNRAHTELSALIDKRCRLSPGHVRHLMLMPVEGPTIPDVCRVSADEETDTRNLLSDAFNCMLDKKASTMQIVQRSTKMLIGLCQIFFLQIFGTQL